MRNAVLFVLLALFLTGLSFAQNAKVIENVTVIKEKDLFGEKL